MPPHTNHGQQRVFRDGQRSGTRLRRHILQRQPLQLCLEGVEGLRRGKVGGGGAGVRCTQGRPGPGPSALPPRRAAPPVHLTHAVGDGHLQAALVPAACQGLCHQVIKHHRLTHQHAQLLACGRAGRGGAGRRAYR